MFIFVRKNVNKAQKYLMKIYSAIVLAVGIVFGGAVNAQTNANKMMIDANKNLDAKEYVTARYRYVQACNAYLTSNNMPGAVKAAVNASALYHRENYYKEAFELLGRVEMSLNKLEQDNGRPMPAEHYDLNKERFKMYMKLKNSARAREQLDKMEGNLKGLSNDSLMTDLMSEQAGYYYTFGQNDRGDAAMKKLIARYQGQKDYDKIAECYRNLIGTALKSGNSRLVARSYDNYMLWTDSVNKIKSNEELAELQAKYNSALEEIDEKESAITSRKAVIVTLCIALAILAAALVFGAIILLRYIALTRKQKKAIIVANEHNELKTRFISNISAQMEPTLDTLDQKQPGVKALHEFSEHIQELSSLESSLGEAYELQDVNILNFCEEIMDGIRDRIKPGVTLSVNAPKMNIKIAPEPLTHVLNHLLNNAALYTPEGGKISLEFKKRGAHTHQFIVTDNGAGIPEEIRQQIFRPFSEVRNLTEGDGLGLPICSLMAIKMNGKLSLDDSFNHGARFVLELHS